MMNPELYLTETPAQPEHLFEISEPDHIETPHNERQERSDLPDKLELECEHEFSHRNWLGK